jgi:hypothetical protein
MPCNAVDKAMIGRRELWMHCGLLPRHEGRHHDPKRPGHYWEETFYAFEFEYGRSTRIGSVKTKKRAYKCKTCGNTFRADREGEVCVCKAIQANRRQAIMFAAERKEIHLGRDEYTTQNDIDWILPYQLARWQEARDNDPDNYCGEF